MSGKSSCYEKWSGCGIVDGMLNDTDRRYVEIVAEKIASDKTYSELATQFNVSVSTVKNAVSWGRTQGMFNKDLTEKLEHHIAEYRGLVAETEKLLQRRIKLEEEMYEHTRELLPATQFSFLMQRLEAQRERLMELEGVYKKSVNVQVKQDTRVLVLPSRVAPSEWEEMVSKFSGRRNESQRDLGRQARGWIDPTDGLYAAEISEDSAETEEIIGTYSEEGMGS